MEDGSGLQADAYLSGNDEDKNAGGMDSTPLDHAKTPGLRSTQHHPGTYLLDDPALTHQRCEPPSYK